jgi:MFS family permease
VSKDPSILRDRRFALLFAARTASVLGSAFGPVALAFGVLALPAATATTLSFVTAAEALSMVVFMLIGGVIADRLPRFRVMMTADLGSALAWGALGVMLVTGWAPLGLMITASALAGMMTALFYPANTGVVPEVVPEAKLQSANGVLRLGMNAARISGFAVAGAAVSLLGAGWAMTLNSGLLLASAAFTAGLRLPRTTRPAAASLVHELHAGWREFRSRQWLWVVVLQYAFVLMVVQAVVGVLGPVVSTQRLGGSTGWSLILGAESVGMLVGVVLAIKARPTRPVRLVVVLTFPLASLPLALGLGAPLALAAVAALVGGVALEFLVVIWDTTMQREIPMEALSRVSSYDALGSLVLGPVGLLLAGPSVVLLGAGHALLASASVIALATFAALCAPGVHALRWSTRPSPVAEINPAHVRPIAALDHQAHAPALADC